MIWRGLALPCEGPRISFVFRRKAFPDYDALVVLLDRLHAEPPPERASVYEDAISRALASGRPAPVPEEARRRMKRGEILFHDAGRDGYGPIIAEMRQAVKLAPAWPRAHFNLALALEGAGRHAEAKRHLELYLRAEPAAEDAAEVRDKIIELELRAERAARRIEPAPAAPVRRK